MSGSEIFYKNFPKLTWDFTAEYIKEHSNKLIEDAKSLIDSVLALKGDQISFEKVIETLALHEAEFESEKNIIGFILSEMMNLCLSYNRNISEENVKLEFVLSDLEGVSDDFIKNLTMKNN
ncbi:hypothetical protein MXB_2002, partial [Myxobolus squamalis]